MGDELSPAIRAAFASDANFGVSSNVSNVSLVEMAQGFSSSWLYDGCHPNEQGEAFMAERWFTAVQAHCPGIVVGANVSRAARRGHFAVSGSPDARTPVCLVALGVATALGLA